MLQLVTWFVFQIIFVSIEGTKPRSVNLALETVVAFDHKDNSANVKFIDDVQNFLSKVRNAVDKKQPVRRNYNTARSIKFTDFLKEIIVILKTYENDDLEDIISVMDDEIRKYHYKGCKFYELIDNHEVRRFVADKLDLVKEQPAKTIRKKLKKTMQAIDDAKFDTKQTDILDYINSLYTKDDGRELEGVLTNLQIYKHKSKRANLDLIELVRNSIKTVIFDHYSSLSPNTRRDFKMKLETFWRNTKQKVNTDHNVWNFKYNNGIELETTKFRKKDELLRMTPAKQDKNDDKEILKVTPEKPKENKKEISRIKNESSHESSDTVGHDLMGLGFPDISDQDGSQDGNTLASDESFKSDKKSSENKKEREKEESSIEESSASDKDSNDKDGNDNDGNGKDDISNEFVTRPIQSDREGIKNNDVVKSKKRKPHNKPIKMTPPLLMTFDSTEKTHRVKDLSIDDESESKKQRKNKKIPSFATLYPETIKHKSKKKGFKIKSTTVNNENRMQTLWEEKIKWIPKHNKKTQKSKLMSNNLDEEDDYRSIIRAQKNKNSVVKPIKSEKKHRHRQKDTIKTKNKNIIRSGNAEENNRNIQVNNEKIKGNPILKSVHDTIDEGNELRFILTAQKKTGDHSKARKTHQDKKSTDSEDENMQTIPKRKNKKASTKKQMNIFPRLQEDLENSQEKVDIKPDRELGMKGRNEYTEEEIQTTPGNAEVNEKSTEEEITTAPQRQITIESFTQELSAPNNDYKYRFEPKSTAEETRPPNKLSNTEAKESYEGVYHHYKIDEKSTESAEELPNSPIDKIVDLTTQKPPNTKHKQQPTDKSVDILRSPQPSDREDEGSIETFTSKPKYKVVKNIIEKLSITKVKNELKQKSKEEPMAQLRYKMVDRTRTIKRYETTLKPSENAMTDVKHRRKHLKGMRSQNKSKPFPSPSDEGMSIESHEPKLSFRRRGNDKVDFNQKDNSVLNRIDYTEKETKATKSNIDTMLKSENQEDFLNDPILDLSDETKTETSTVTPKTISTSTTNDDMTDKENVISIHSISESSPENKSEINLTSIGTDPKTRTKTEEHTTTESNKVDNATLSTPKNDSPIVTTELSMKKMSKSEPNYSLEDISNIAMDTRRQASKNKLDLIPLANEEANAIETANEEDGLQKLLQKYTTAAEPLENKSTLPTSSVKTTHGIDIGAYLASKSTIGILTEDRKKEIANNLDKHMSNVFDKTVMPFSEILAIGKNSTDDLFANPMDVFDDMNF